ncbi:ribose 5-phosphate isomerase B [Clostridium sp. AN503]|uniref:ribose 5-phosphate isomerase B n=1 Tax=Clostridium sp. AN503 TaxID=3160598 RepID=UPI003458E4D8
MKIVIGNDHTALEMKEEIRAYVESKGYEVIDVGTNGHESCDYPEFGEKVGRAVAAGEADYGIAICGTGIGIGIAAGKVKGVRVCTCSEPYSARLSRMHNDTNVLTFGARVIGVEMAKMIVDEWLDNSYEGGRHKRRVDQLMEIEKRQ